MKIIIIFLLLCSLFSCNDGVNIVVDSGDYPRYHSVIEFELPQQFEGKDLMVISDNGLTLPLQLLPSGKAVFIIPQMEADQQISFMIEESKNKKFTNIISKNVDGRYDFSFEELPIISYQFQPILPADTIPESYRRGGYIHPVYTPEGKIVTGDFAFNHLHHHGIWAAWTKTEFQDRKPDFWNMGKETGTVVPVALDSIWTGPVMAGLKSRHNYVDLSSDEPVTAVNEWWEINVYPIYSGKQNFMMFDLQQVNQCATDDPLYLPEYHYGGVGFRGNGQWNGKDNTFFLTSEGRNREEGHATKANWCHIGGLVEGRSTGVAILCHPDNFRAPQPMRIHPNEPFFCYAPSQGGDWAINPGEKYEAKYRYIVYDGEPDPDMLQQMWLDYAHPVSVSIIN